MQGCAWRAQTPPGRIGYTAARRARGPLPRRCRWCSRWPGSTRPGGRAAGRLRRTSGPRPWRPGARPCRTHNTSLNCTGPGRGPGPRRRGRAARHPASFGPRPRRSRRPGPACTARQRHPRRRLFQSQKKRHQNGRRFWTRCPAPPNRRRLSRCHRWAERTPRRTAGTCRGPHGGSQTGRPGSRNDGSP